MAETRLHVIGQNTGRPRASRALPQVAAEKPPSRPAVPIAKREDQEFLPAALEILETPPSPVKMALIVFFAVFVTIALLWMYFGRLDIVAIAQGKIQPPGRVKIVQPVETAKVKRIVATNGMKVAAGDILLEFEDQDALADVDALKAAAATLRAEIFRREQALQHAKHPETSTQDAHVTGPWPADLPDVIRLREESVLRADIAQLDAALRTSDRKIALKESERRTASEMVAAQSALVENLRERVAMRTTLANSGSGSRASLIDGKETLLREEAILTGYHGSLRDAEKSLDLLEAEKKNQVHSFLAEHTQKRAEAGKTLEDVSQRLIKAETRLGYATLRSPADGIVQASTVYTVGQVVTPAQEIMRIVPFSDSLEIEAYLPNKDVGFVEVGQDVAVKVESFPYTRYGMLAGKVAHIARDAIPEADAARIEGSPARPSESQAFAGAQRLQNLVFPITVTIEKPELVVDGQRITMTPGMAVSAEIKTSSRRILEYLLSPLLEVTSESLRER